MLHIVNISFSNYKSFKQFVLFLNTFNILAGPNNAGKSTVIGAFKFLTEGIRKARSKKPELIRSPEGGNVLGYKIEIEDIPVATENVFHNYNEDNCAIIRFKFSNNSSIRIFFPAAGECYMVCENESRIIRSPADFKNYFPIDIGFIPILGPVEHKEQLFQKEAARLALYASTASRNFRNIWYHYPEHFAEFRQLIRDTWPGMDIDPPEIDWSYEKPVLNMFCPEERMPREIYWAGFGFQVWCQMLTYLVQNKHASIIIIDEPDIYLHSDLQRQLLGILKNIGTDVIIATHSTEILSEADISDILLINKNAKIGKRVKDPSQVQDIFKILGSSLNPILTQIAKTRRVLFVEGKDFSIFSKFARHLKLDRVANRGDFAVVPVEGFNPQKLRFFKEGIEKAIGGKVLSAVIFDRDYRSDGAVTVERGELERNNYFAHIHSGKEIENFLIIPAAIERAVCSRIKEVNVRSGTAIAFAEDITELLKTISEGMKIKVLAQLQSLRHKYEKSVNPRLNEATINETIFTEFDQKWQDLDKRLKLIPGKEFLSLLNRYLQDHYKVTISATNIISHIGKGDFPPEMKALLEAIDEFKNLSAETIGSEAKTSEELSEIPL
jgi:AAA15 family ATPase/GTPase